MLWLALGLWIACGLVFPIWATIDDGEFRIRYIGLTILSMIGGPIVLLIYLFSSEGLGDRVIWRRKAKP